MAAFTFVAGKLQFEGSLSEHNIKMVMYSITKPRRIRKIVMQNTPDYTR